MKYYIYKTSRVGGSEFLGPYSSEKIRNAAARKLKKSAPLGVIFFPANIPDNVVDVVTKPNEEEVKEAS